MQKKEMYLYSVIALLGIGTLVYFMTKKNKNTVIEEMPTVTEEAPPPATANIDLVLSLGSEGLEVSTLQKLLGFTGIDVDGDFGSKTEARLYSLKGVKKISLRQYKSLPTINVNVLNVGTRVMANINTSTPTKVYLAKRKADGTFYTDYSSPMSFNYGDEIGTIKSKDGTGLWYVVLVSGYFTDDYYFVKSTEVKKI